MDERIRGSYPGGPKRDREPGGDERPVRLRGVEEMESSRARRSLCRSRRSRRRRAWAGLAAVLAVAFAVGAALGLSSHETQETLTRREEASARQDLDISKEVNRTLLQLWKMEDLEAARNRGAIR